MVEDANMDFFYKEEEQKVPSEARGVDPILKMVRQGEHFWQSTRTFTEKSAKLMGLSPLTYGYKIPSELWMLDRVTRDLTQAKVRYYLVRTAENQVEVWTKKKPQR